jgi:hypothetical protein
VSACERHSAVRSGEGPQSHWRRHDFSRAQSERFGRPADDLPGRPGGRKARLRRTVSARYERASLIVTSNKPFSAWGEIFGDETTAVAMIDRLVHNAEILSLKGDSYRLRGKDLGARPGADSAQLA